MFQRFWKINPKQYERLRRNDVGRCIAEPIRKKLAKFPQVNSR